MILTRGLTRCHSDGNDSMPKAEEGGSRAESSQQESEPSDQARSLSDRTITASTGTDAR